MNGKIGYGPISSFTAGAVVPCAGSRLPNQEPGPTCPTFPHVGHQVGTPEIELNRFAVEAFPAIGGGFTISRFP